jgi:UDP-2,3-diacylglucosamine pyrophosphatase LpxH
MESLLVLSDVHLGSDLNDVGRPIRRSRRVDEDLVKLISHYRTVPTSERWHLVVAGDFIDFVGMAVRAEGVELATERTREERKHGLGNAVDHVRVKLRMVVERHRDVFDALADFVAAGNAITFIHGNHDLELHWDAVKDDLRSLLFARACATQTHAVDGPAFDGRIAFHPWFFYIAGLAYIEHGHQYDGFCASEYVMAPLSAADPCRITRSVSDVLLRFVVRPTRGMHEYGHDRHGILHYVAFAMNLGVAGLLQLAARYAGAVGELFRLRREQLSEAAKWLGEEHDRSVALLARATRLGVERMRALAALQVPPVTRTIGGILASVLLDRLALGFAAVLTLLVVAFLTIMQVVHAWWAAPIIIAAWALGHRQLARRRTADPAESMIERAAHLAKLFPAAFVVMGHTHAPARMTINDGEATYINVGSWAEEEGDDGEPADDVYRAARTHLVLHRGDDGPIAEFLAWDGDGPRPFTPADLAPSRARRSNRASRG